MMSRTFDPQQQVVLDSNNTRQLVSASAGSGKTTVMIQKITNLLLNKTTSPDQLLVITFTNLASTEMKERLVANLTEALVNANEQDKYFIQELLEQIQTASIDTIDGFCSKMLKKYFYKSGLEPELKIISSFSEEYYINKALDLSIKQYQQISPEKLVILCDIFEKKDRSLANLKESLLQAFRFSIVQKDYYSFLINAVDQYKNLNTTSCNYLNKYIVKYTKQNLTRLKMLLPQFTEYTKLHRMVDNFASFLSKININNSLIENSDILHLCPTCSFKTTERIGKENYDYEQLKYLVKQLQTLISNMEFIQYIKDEQYLNEVSSHLNSFIELLTLFISTYTKLKQDNNVIDFNDLERNMLTLLQQKDILDDLHNTYKYIFVDEYQDINPMQDELINKILDSSSNLFMVGDVKQSIYGFRQSTPDLFIAAYKNYKQNPSLGKSFDMNINFRSNPQILKFNNEIFSHLMTEEKADIDYANTSKFEPKREDFPHTNAVEILVVNEDSEIEEEYACGVYDVLHHINPTEQVDAKKLEIDLVVNKIKDMVGTEFYDASLKENRPLRYEDIAILSRSVLSNPVQNLANSLMQNNIPINISSRTNLKDSEAVNKVLSILKVINFTASDIDYTYWFTCPLVNVTYNELLSVYTDKTSNLYTNLIYYCNTFKDNLSIKLNYGFNLIKELTQISSSCNTVQLINTILNKYHLRQHIIASEKGFEQLCILNEFLYSLSIEEQNLSITKFIDLIEKNLSSSKELVARDCMDSVTIQTIHASKGLEYPVVILFDASHQFTYVTEHKDLNFDLNLGVGMQYFDLTNRKRYESPTRYAISLKNKDTYYKEELRLLYVATTRAKNKLIISGCCSETKLKNNTLSMDNYLHLILSTYYSKINTQPLLTTYNFVNCDISIYDQITTEQAVMNSIPQSVLAEDNLIKNNINFEYPYANETNISVKNNVTAVSKILNDDYNILPSKLNISENLNATTDDLAEIGTLYHNVLAEIDYNKPYNYKHHDKIDEKLIKLAYNKIAEICKNSIKQETEKQFMMYLPYNEIFTDSNISSKILVQGVIDLMFEFDDHIVLIDYKYSSLPINKLKEKYKNQIMLYKIAIEKAYKKPVTESYIYSIKTGDLG